MTTLRRAICAALLLAAPLAAGEQVRAGDPAAPVSRPAAPAAAGLRGCYTVDMEAGHLARLATRLGVEVGYEKGGDVRTHQENFMEEVVHPEHLREALGLQAVYRWRRLDPQERARLADAPTSDWPPLLYGLGLGYMELKIKSYVLCEEIERVYLPPEAKGDIPDRLRARGIPFEYRDPSSDPR